MGSSGMGVDANGKPIKRQAPANNNNNMNKKGGNNQKKGNNQNKNNNRNNNNNQQGGNRNQNRQHQHQQQPMMAMVPPFGPMGPGGPGGPGFMGPPGGFFNGGQPNRRSGGGKVLGAELGDFTFYATNSVKSVVNSLDPSQINMKRRGGIQTIG